jgi:hypothetical protein
MPCIYDFVCFDNSAQIRILQHVLKCVGINFSTTDDDPLFVIGPLYGSSKLDV